MDEQAGTSTASLGAAGATERRNVDANFATAANHIKDLEEKLHLMEQERNNTKSQLNEVLETNLDLVTENEKLRADLGDDKTTFYADDLPSTPGDLGTIPSSSTPMVDIVPAIVAPDLVGEISKLQSELEVKRALRETAEKRATYAESSKEVHKSLSISVEKALDSAKAEILELTEKCHKMEEDKKNLEAVPRLTPIFMKDLRADLSASYDRNVKELEEALVAKQVAKASVEMERLYYSGVLKQVQKGESIDCQTNYEQVRKELDDRDHRRSGSRSRSLVPSKSGASSRSVWRETIAAESTSTRTMHLTSTTPKTLSNIPEESGTDNQPGDAQT